MLIPLGEANERCGGKAANLARLLHGGFTVPLGFVVLDALRADGWVREVGTALRDLDAGSFAVRSSALGEDGTETSFAGQLHSALDITEPTRVTEEVRRAARSGTSPEAVAYAARMGREPEAVVPVIVQCMIRAEIAGVMFTRHPVTGAGDVVIEAGRGLGEDVVGGTVTPWTWTVDGRTVTRLTGGLGPLLTQAQVLDLADVGRRIEAVFGCPQDVEWAIADGTVWVLQSRPVTTNPVTTNPVTANPVTANPVTTNPVTANPLTANPLTANPLTANPLTATRARHDEGVASQVLASGTPASPGTAEGPVRVVEGLDDFVRFGAGDVLVCRTTSPAWTPLLARAAAVVTETGGLLAHAAIVAREFGIPAVLAVPDALSVLTDGRPVVVDGTAGTIATTDVATTEPPEER